MNDKTHCEIDPQLVQEVALLHDHVCKGLSDPKRIVILYALRERPCYVSELAAGLDTPQPTISRHLKVLRDCGLVTTTREGASVYYAIRDMRIIDALELLRGLLRDNVMQQTRMIAPDAP